VTAARSPAIIIRFPDVAAPAARDLLAGLLSDHDLIAIQEDDISAPRVWTAHFASGAARDRALAALQALGDMRLDVAAAEIEDEDWARRTQSDLPAVRVGRIVVAPPWDLPPDLPRTGAAGAELVVEIEPSRGFGTGHHQSTRLCLVLLQNQALANRSVVDVGTGSGVLAIAAARLGAGYVTAIDADPDAVENARENIARNGVAVAVEAHVRDVAASAPPPADLVTANLTGTLLVRYAGPLTRLVRPGGSLICAGFTVDEKDAVLEAFSGAFDLTETAEEEGWWAFALRRR
jgi:ribosomal protein L11 methyltransferase